MLQDMNIIWTFVVAIWVVISLLVHRRHCMEKTTTLFYTIARLFSTKRYWYTTIKSVLQMKFTGWKKYKSQLISYQLSAMNTQRERFWCCPLLQRVQYEWRFFKRIVYCVCILTISASTHFMAGFIHATDNNFGLKWVEIKWLQINHTNPPLNATATSVVITALCWSGASTYIMPELNLRDVILGSPYQSLDSATYVW